MAVVLQTVPHTLGSKVLPTIVGSLVVACVFSSATGTRTPLQNYEILKEGYIYPKEERPVRDLLRKRGHLMKLRTSLLVSLQNTVANVCGRQDPDPSRQG